MYPFRYHRPASLAEAAALLACGDSDPRLLAGGQTLIPTLKQRLARPTDLIDIGRLAALRGIAPEGTALVIGAGETHAAVAESPLVTTSIPALAALARGIGDPHVRHMGTLGGSIANNDPSADYPAALVALGARIRTTDRQIEAEDFFCGLFETALEPAEIITAVCFPCPSRAAYEKIPSPASRYALVGVFVAEAVDGVRVAVTGAGAGVFRVPAFEAALSRQFRPDALNGLPVPADSLTTDLHGSADYRAHLIGVAARRAVANAIG